MFLTVTAPGTLTAPAWPESTWVDPSGSYVPGFESQDPKLRQKQPVRQ